MSYGKHTDVVLKFDKYERIGETRKQCTSDLQIGGGVCQAREGQRACTDRLLDHLDFFEKARR